MDKPPERKINIVQILEDYDKAIEAVELKITNYGSGKFSTPTNIEDLIILRDVLQMKRAEIAGKNQK